MNMSPCIAGKSSGTSRSRPAQRSAYFSRREAAGVLRTVIDGHKHLQNQGSIKSLVYSPSIKNKKATFALVCQTLKYLTAIRDVLESAQLLNNKWKDVLLIGGDAEKFLFRHKGVLQSALARFMVKHNVKKLDELMPTQESAAIAKPCFVRVNTLKLDTNSAFQELEKRYMVFKDDTVPNLLVLPEHTDLHDHPLIMSGRIFMQGKASTMAAAALDPEPGWEVLDACAAPGNKTVHLAALMKGSGRIIACELNKPRLARLQDTVTLSGATNIEILHGDFLKIDPENPAFSKVSAILLDPSCSGSGMAAQRLDHLLPGHNIEASAERLKKLSVFQKKALIHTFSFPRVRRIVYSTCSIHKSENEDVVFAALPTAAFHGFRLVTVFPQWHRRGFPVFEGAEHLLRMDPVEDKEGFFIALFVRTNSMEDDSEESSPHHVLNPSIQKSHHKRTAPVKRKIIPRPCGGISRFFKMLNGMQA